MRILEMVLFQAVLLFVVNLWFLLESSEFLNQSN